MVAAGAALQLPEVPELSQREIFTDLNVPPVLGWEILLVLGCENVAEVISYSRNKLYQTMYKYYFPLTATARPCKNSNPLYERNVANCLLAVGK